MSSGGSSKVREKMVSIVSSDNVSSDESEISSFKEPWIGLDAQPSLIVKPRNMEEILDIVETANEMGLNIVPVSSGPPHSRGDTSPDGDAVVVDMTGMNEITWLDRKNKVALIEPGVRFGKLKQRVEREGLKLLMPLMPRSTKSVIGSYIEREPILTPKFHWDMTDPLLCTELVFGSGNLFRTGSAGGPGSLSRQRRFGIVQKNPMGPAQTDFAKIVQGAQGTMSVVTWATVKLEIAPTIEEFYFIENDKFERIAEFTYSAMRPKYGDTFLIVNNFMLANMVSDEPESIRKIADSANSFVVILSAAGYKYYPEERLEYQTNALKKIAQSSGVVMKKDAPGTNSRKIKELLENPSPEPYWKTRFKGGFLELFFLTTLDRVESFIEIMKSVCEKTKYDFSEVGIYIQPIQQGRNVHIEFDLYFDPSDKSEVLATRKTLDVAAKEMIEAGAFFSRPYGNWAELAYSKCPDTVSALRKVKGILDPNGVMNRGKLCFREVGV